MTNLLVETEVARIGPHWLRMQRIHVTDHDVIRWIVGHDAWGTLGSGHQHDEPTARRLGEKQLTILAEGERGE